MCIKDKYTLSIVVPVYNEELVIGKFHDRTSSVLDSLQVPSEIIYINDGSTDTSLDILKNLKDSRVAIIDLSRNFGKEIAMTAGLDSCKGNAVIIIDADLQDPPELIPELIKKWQEGYDVVYAQRTVRDGETILKKSTAKLFYKVIKLVSRVEIPQDAGDFRLLSRRAVEAVKQLREHHRFMKGLFAWVGFSQTAVYYRREPRFAGSTKWNYWRLWNFALEGITSFSIAPLKIATYTGLSVALSAFIYAVFIVTKTLIFGDPVQGYPTIMVAMLSLGGVQLFCIGLIGEYLGRMFNESKKRPLYFINKHFPSQLQKIEFSEHLNFENIKT